MGQFVIEGQNRLDGKIRVQGSKNSALPILAATVAVGKPCIIHNCPNLSDINSTLKILKGLGCEVHRCGNSVSIDSSKITQFVVNDELMRELRSSIIFLGALISRVGEAVMTAPGGCDIGARPIDLHLSSMEKLGVSICEKFGKLHCRCVRTKGAKIALSFPSVGATENIILASIRAVGTTTIINAAREPEIVDLVRFLNSCGAKISGAGESTIVIEGVESFRSVQYIIIPDRICACTYLACAAVTGSSIILEDVVPNHLLTVIQCFEQADCKISVSQNQIKIVSPSRLKSMETIRTMPYPGFPTDCQAIIMSMASVAKGTTVFSENIFENRFCHAIELNRMGANISLHEKIAVVSGVRSLQGSIVDAHDLRAGAALVVAGLCAEGKTTVNNIQYIDRGYEALSSNLTAIGAKIQRND